MTSTQAEQIARLKAQTGVIRKKRYRGVIGIGLGAIGLFFALAGFPMEVSFVLWGLGAASWFILKAV